MNVLKSKFHSIKNVNIECKPSYDKPNMNETKDFKLIFNENLQSNKIFVGGLTSIIDEGNYFLFKINSVTISSNLVALFSAQF